jgi:hypothetical protein
VLETSEGNRLLDLKEQRQAVCDLDHENSSVRAVIEVVEELNPFLFHREVGSVGLGARRVPAAELHTADDLWGRVEDGITGANLQFVNGAEVQLLQQKNESLPGTIQVSLAQIRLGWPMRRARSRDEHDCSFQLRAVGMTVTMKGASREAVRARGQRGWDISCSSV